MIAVQDHGYGEIDGEALNAQDIAGPKDAPAFSISQKDAAVLKAALQEEERLIVEFDASSRILEQTESYNIWGTIPGREEDMILLSAHYDSYYDGFQDDNCAVAMMLGIARALLETGYRPRKTLVFCAMAAEESKPASYFKWVRLKTKINSSCAMTKISKKTIHGPESLILAIHVFIKFLMISVPVFRP